MQRRCSNTCLYHYYLLLIVDFHVFFNMVCCCQWLPQKCNLQLAGQGKQLIWMCIPAPLPLSTDITKIFMYQVGCTINYAISLSGVIWSSHATNETCLRVDFVPLNDSGTASYKLPKLYGLRDYGQTDVALLVLAEPNWPQQSQKRNQQNTYPASNGRWMCVNSRLCNASRRKAQLTITPPAHSLSSKQQALTQDGHMPRIQGNPTTERWDSFWYWPIWTCVSGLTILHDSYFLFWARPFTGLV